MKDRKKARVWRETEATRCIAYIAEVLTWGEKKQSPVP